MCVSGVGIMSFFFNISSNPEPLDGKFFNFMDDPKAPLDLGALIPMDFSLKHSVLGYVGTETVPNCERGVCWYFVNQTYAISQAHYNKILIDGVSSNVRNLKERKTAYK